MTTRKFTILFFLLIAFSGFAQNIKISYTEINSLGAPNANLKAYNAALFVTKKTVLYVTQVDSLENGRKTINKKRTLSNGGISIVRSFSFKNGLFNITDRASNFMYSNARFYFSFSYKEKVPKINWTITNQTKKIEGITVQKAVTRFRGRGYIAWYAPSIPAPFGPWKLQGLPGLIIEARDTNNEIEFLFKKLEYPYNKLIHFPQLKTTNTLKELKVKRSEQIERNKKFSRTMLQSSNGTESKDFVDNLKRSVFLELEFAE